MKLKYLMVGAIATVCTLTIACSRNEAALQTTEATPHSSVISNDTSNDPAPGTAAQSGQFVMGEHPTLGAAQIVTENGKRYLVFDAAFKTDAGPDLFVLLHREKMPRTYDTQSYISLGALQQVSGGQRYEIPAEVDLGTFQSAVIWCRQFNATFGYAPFQ
jgi:hypothetical protein